MRLGQPNYVSIDIQVAGVTQAIARLQQVQQAMNAMSGSRAVLNINRMTGSMGGFGRSVSMAAGSLREWLAHVALMPAKIFLILEAFRLATILADMPKKLIATAASMVQAYAKVDMLRRGLTAIMGTTRAAGDELLRLREVAKLPGIGFPEAIEGSVALQAAGMSADEARDSLMAFANALATVGRGREYFDRVKITLSQLRGMATGFGREIRELLLAVPQVGPILERLFGTKETMKIAKMGYTGQAIVKLLVAELLKLPRVTGGVANALENLKDAFLMMWERGGRVIVDKVGPALAFLIDALDRIAESGVMERIVRQWLGLAAAVSAANLARIGLARLLAVLELMPITLRNLGIVATNVFTFLLDNIRLLATWILLPFSSRVVMSIFSVVKAIVVLNGALRSGVGIAAALRALIDPSGLAAVAAAIIGGLGTYAALGMLIPSGEKLKSQMADSLGGALDPEAVGALSGRYEKMLLGFDPKAGLFGTLAAATKSAIEQRQQIMAKRAAAQLPAVPTPLMGILNNTAATAANTRRMADALDWRMQGLGVSGADALGPTRRDIARWGGRKQVQVNLQGGGWFEQSMRDYVAQLLGEYEAQRSLYAPVG